MRRRLVALLVAGLVLGACGTISAASALRAWVDQSSFHSAVSTLRLDAVHAAKVLRNVRSSSNDLHTVCGVLSLETTQANAALPTSDGQATSLLSKAYTYLGQGANECYDAGGNASARAKALTSLEAAMAAFSEATARVAAAS